MLRAKTLNVASNDPAIRPWLVSARILAMQGLNTNVVAITDNSVMAAALRFKRVPFIFDAHSIGPRARLLRFALRSPFLKGCICNSRRMEQQILKLVGRGIPTLVLGSGIRTELFRSMPDRMKARSMLGIPDSRIVIGYVGSMGMDRGIDHMLHAAKQSREKSDKAFWLFVGGSSSECEYWRQFARDHGIEDHVIRFVGHQPQQALRDWYACIDIVCAAYSSQVATAEIMSPMKLVEYRAAGRPIIASDLPAIRDALFGEDCVVYFSPDSPRALHEAVTECMTKLPALQDKSVDMRQRALREGWDAKAASLHAWLQRLECGAFANNP
jgi:glycosyltransferase involved in cell wall biosynthesis